MTPEQISKLISRLDADARDALAAEWELIVLCAISSAGRLEHEAELCGLRRLDVLTAAQVLKRQRSKQRSNFDKELGMDYESQ